MTLSWVSFFDSSFSIVKFLHNPEVGGGLVWNFLIKPEALKMGHMRAICDAAARNFLPRDFLLDTEAAY